MECLEKEEGGGGQEGFDELFWKRSRRRWKASKVSKASKTLKRAPRRGTLADVPRRPRAAGSAGSAHSAGRQGGEVDSGPLAAIDRPVGVPSHLAADHLPCERTFVYSVPSTPSCLPGCCPQRQRHMCMRVYLFCLCVFLCVSSKVLVVSVLLVSVSAPFSPRCRPIRSESTKSPLRRMQLRLSNDELAWLRPSTLSRRISTSVQLGHHQFSPLIIIIIINHHRSSLSFKSEAPSRAALHPQTFLSDPLHPPCPSHLPM